MAERLTLLKQGVLAYLADPVRTLAGLNYFAAGCCLAVGWLPEMAGLPGVIFGGVGTYLWLAVRAAMRAGGQQ